MDQYFSKIIGGERDEESIKALNKFVNKALKVFSFPELQNGDTRTKLWQALYNLTKTSEDLQVLKNCFIAVRILSREKADLNELVDNEWLSLIQTHSGLNDIDFQFNKDKLQLAIEVEKSLCNLIFNSSFAAKSCCNNGILEQVARRLKECQTKKIPEEIIFFDAKLIFLLTALRSEIRNNVRQDMHAATSLITILDNVLKTTENSQKLSVQNADLVCEILKALFNLTLNCYGNCNDVEEDEQCKHLVKMLRMFLLVPNETEEKSLAIKNNIINLFTNVPETYYEYFIPRVEGEQNISKQLQFEDHDMSALAEILEALKKLLTEEQGVSQQYENLSPTLSVLLKFATSERLMRKYLRQEILPPLTDVHHRPEQGATLRNQLCKLLTSPITQLRDIVSELLFVLCKKNVKRMIKYTGYGNAAGLFAQRGLLGGRSDKGEADFSADSDSETEEYAQFKHGINPVIGCYEEPRPSPMENMTEEQKEYEAMKLVELIDSLTKCGAIQPCRVGADGKPHPIEHVLQLQEGLKMQQVHNQESDSE